MAEGYFVLHLMPVSLQDAIRKSMAVLTQIDFDGMYFRRDIGYEFL